MARMISSRKMAVSTVLVILMGMLACTVVANLPPLVKNPNMLQLNTRYGERICACSLLLHSHLPTFLPPSSSPQL